MTVTRHNPPAAPAVARYSQVVRVELGQSALLLISGQVAVDSEGRLVGRADVLAQADQVYSNLVAVLASQGAGLEHIVKTTTFVKDGVDLTLLRSRARFQQDALPAATLVVVTSLANPEWLLEMEAIAVVPIA